jgi:hypothetical protein
MFSKYVIAKKPFGQLRMNSAAEAIFEMDMQIALLAMTLNSVTLLDLL